MVTLNRLFSRYYNDYYSPLGTHPQKRPSGRMLFAAALLALSLLLNLVAVIKYLNRFTSPLDDYQEL